MFCPFVFLLVSLHILKHWTSSFRLSICLIIICIDYFFLFCFFFITAHCSCSEAAVLISGMLTQRTSCHVSNNNNNIDNNIKTSYGTTVFPIRAFEYWVWLGHYLLLSVCTLKIPTVINQFKDHTMFFLSFKRALLMSCFLGISFVFVLFCKR